MWLKNLWGKWHVHTKPPSSNKMEDFNCGFSKKKKKLKFYHKCETWTTKRNAQKYMLSNTFLTKATN